MPEEPPRTAASYVRIMYIMLINMMGYGPSVVAGESRDPYRSGTSGFCRYRHTATVDSPLSRAIGRMGPYSRIGDECLAMELVLDRLE